MNWIYLESIRPTPRFADTEQTLAVSADPEEGAADPTDEVYCIAVNQMEEFWEETFFHMAKFGEIEDLITVDNISEHVLLAPSNLQL